MYFIERKEDVKLERNCWVWRLRCIFGIMIEIIEDSNFIVRHFVLSLTSNFKMQILIKFVDPMIENLLSSVEKSSNDCNQLFLLCQRLFSICKLKKTNFRFCFVYIIPFRHSSD